AARDREHRAALEDALAGIVLLPGADGRVDLAALLELLGQRGINELTVEAGGTLAGALLSRGLVDEAVLYQAPVLLGDGLPLAEFTLASLAQRLTPRVLERRMVGDDQRLTLRFTEIDAWGA
ncbi:RibD family protein, partial [Chitiniphilus shinanonensis]|uniref:RibD family protein n=1 Tax=Chitiniphilus shinanonensis TaxID=553088 RepID=UPI0024E0ED82